MLTGWTVDGLAAGAARAAAARSRRAARRDAPEPTVAFAFRDAARARRKTLLGRRYAEDGVGARASGRSARCAPSVHRAVRRDEAGHALRQRRSAGRRGRSRRARVPRHRRRPARGRATRSSICPKRGGRRRAKFRTPQDWIIAVLRAFGAREVARQRCRRAAAAAPSALGAAGAEGLRRHDARSGPTPTRC